MSTLLLSSNTNSQVSATAGFRVPCKGAAHHIDRAFTRLELPRCAEVVRDCWRATVVHKSVLPGRRRSLLPQCHSSSVAAVRAAIAAALASKGQHGSVWGGSPRRCRDSTRRQISASRVAVTARPHRPAANWGRAVSAASSTRSTRTARSKSTTCSPSSTSWRASPRRFELPVADVDRWVAEHPARIEVNLRESREVHRAAARISSTTGPLASA
jgi:hypothetical protein